MLCPKACAIPVDFHTKYLTKCTPDVTSGQLKVNCIFWLLRRKGLLTPYRDTLRVVSGSSGNDVKFLNIAHQVLCRRCVARANARNGTVQLQIKWPLLQQVLMIHFGPVVADKNIL